MAARKTTGLIEKSDASIVALVDGLVGGRCADWLVANFPSDLKLVVTVAENDIYRKLKSAGIPVSIFSNTEQLARDISTSESSFDLGLLLWWPQVVSKSVFELPRHGFINTHPSLLPFGKGRNPNFWALVAQEPYGVSLHRVEEELDSGGVLAQRRISHSWEDTGGSLYAKALVEMVALFKEYYPVIRTFSFGGSVSGSSIGPIRKAVEMERKSVINLDGPTTARQLLNLLRARTFPGHPACSFEQDGVEYEVQVRVERKK